MAVIKDQKYGHCIFGGDIDDIEIEEVDQFMANSAFIPLKCRCSTEIGKRYLSCSDPQLFSVFDGAPIILETCMVKIVSRVDGVAIESINID